MQQQHVPGSKQQHSRNSLRSFHCHPNPTTSSVLDNMSDVNKTGMTATEQKELRRVFNHLANFLPKQSIYSELNPLVERSAQLSHFLKNPEVLKVHDMDGNEMRSDDVVREQADLQLKVDELRKRILDYDNSPTSKIHAADLNEAMRLLGRKCTKKEIEDMVWEVDENLDGCVDWEEFKVGGRLCGVWVFFCWRLNILESE